MKVLILKAFLGIINTPSRGDLEISHNDDKASEGQKRTMIRLGKIRFGGSTCLHKNYETYKVTRNVVNPSLD